MVAAAVSEPFLLKPVCCSGHLVLETVNVPVYARSSKQTRLRRLDVLLHAGGGCSGRERVPLQAWDKSGV